LGKSTKAIPPEGEKTAKITEKEPAELQWADFTLQYHLLKGASERKKGEVHRSRTSRKRKVRKRRRRKPSS